MSKPLVIVLAASLGLSACGSALNPFNWFGRSEPVQTQTGDEDVNPLIPRAQGIQILSLGRNAPEIDNTTPIATVTDIRVERIPGGALIRATGLDPTQGIFNAKLEPANDDEEAVDGVLTYRLQRETSGTRAVGGPATREVVVARRVTDSQLEGVRIIRVEAEQNARQVRR